MSTIQTLPADIPPSPNRADPPDFSRMEAAQFEELTCSLFEKEPGISKADLYRTQFQLQYGIDVIADQISDNDIEVASCKCYAKVSKGEIAKWSTDFLEHWDTHWKDKKVKKFVLAVTANVNSQERDAEVEAEKKRFEQYGIKYEVWAPRTLQEKIRRHPGLVSQYLGVEWVTRLCGSAPPPAPYSSATTNMLSSLVIRQLEELQTALSGEVLQRFNHVRDLMRTGDNAKVNEELKALREGKFWQQLTPPAQAQIICLQGSLAITNEDLSTAEQLANEADAVVPGYTGRVRAMIADERYGPNEALVVLGEPQGIDAIQLQVALLLEAGRIQEAVSVLEKSPLLDADDAETTRLKAFTALLQGNRERAYVAICKAEQLAPGWTAVKRAAAIMRYALAVSPHVSVRFILSPSPLPIELIKEDDQSQRYIQEALTRFQSLWDVSTKKQRASDEIWEVACLCNLRSKAEAAREKCLTILERDPCHPEVISWALARGIDFDTQRSLDELQRMLDSSQGSSAHVLAYAWLLVSREEIPAATNVLEKYQDRFTSPAEQAALTERLNDLAAMRGSSSSVCEESTDLGVLLEQAKKSGNWDKIEALFVDQITTKPTTPHCLATAEVLASKKRWGILYAHIAGLLSFETSAAVRIAAYTAFNSRRPELAYKILEEGRHHFPGRLLPHDLRVLEVHTLSLQGDAAGALKRASLLASESSSLSHRLLSADLHIRAGDLAGALPAIREANQVKKLNATDALRFAAVIGVEDLELARELWRHALKAGIPDHFAAAAMTQAYRFGIDKEAKPLFSTLNRLAEDPKSGVYLVDIEGIVDQQRTWHEKAIQANEQYSNGAIPIHVFAEAFDVDLARLYYLNQSQQYKTNHSKRIFIRNGARPAEINIGVPLNSWRLHLDVTSLLIAGQLQMLDIIESLPNPIILPSSLPQALVQLEVKASHHQPKFLEAQVEILEALNANKITAYRTSSGSEDGPMDSASAISWAMQQSGFFVDYEMPDRVDELEATQFRTISAVAQGLRNAGAIDAKQFEEAYESLGVRNPILDHQAIAQGSSVLFLSNTLTVLANAGLLDAVASTYDAYVDGFLIRTAKVESQQAAEQAKVKTMIGGLRRRISQGITNGKYITTAQAWKVNDANPVEDEEDDRRGVKSEALAGITEFLKTSPPANSVFWIDDRYLTGFPTIQNAPLIGVFEVLNELKKNGLLRETSYFESLARLRASGAMFLPIDSAEVLYHLDAASVVAGEVIETPALANLRRYIAHILLLERNLKIGQFPEGLEGRPDEIPVLMELRRLADSCLVDLWKTQGIDLSVIEARSNWIWSALNVERVLGEHQTIAQNATETRTLPALELASLVVNAIQMSSKAQSNGVSNRSAYLQWLSLNLLDLRCSSDAQLEKEIGLVLRQLISGLLKKDRNDTFAIKYRREIRHILGRTVSEFPERLKSIVLQDAEIAKEIGVQTIRIITEGKQQFLPHQFWKAIAKALKYGSAVLHTVNTKERVLLSRSRRREFEVEFSGKEPRYYSDPAFALLTKNTADIRKVLSAQIDWFDVPRPEREAAITQILDKAGSARMLALDEVRARSASMKYADANSKIKAGTEFPLDLFLPPSGRALLAHLRLDDDTNQSFTTRLEQSAKMLVEEYGVEEAFERFVGLPCPIPDHILEALRMLDDTTKTGVTCPLELVRR